MKKVIFLLGGIFISIIALPVAITKKLYYETFGSRYNQSFDYYEVMRERFPELTRKRSIFLSNRGQKLVGFYYYVPTKEAYKATIIWVHGMRTSHENYIGEIAYFAKRGYLVFSYDNTGVGKSEGKTLVGLTQAPIDLSYAIAHIAKNEKVKNLQLVLMGHSWGGFAVSSVCSKRVKKDVSIIVSISGFEKNSRVIKTCGKLFVGRWIEILMPYVNCYERILFSKDSRLRGIDGIAKTNAKVLFLHCEDDSIVNYHENFELYKSEFKDTERIQFLSYKTGGHRPTLCRGAFEKILAYTKKQSEYDSRSLVFHKIEEKKCSLTLNLNLNIMAEISEFIEKNLNK